MSHHVYTTRALILSYASVREADRLYTLLTRDLGLIRARAIGVRREKSKLRGNLEPFALASVSLVRGKEMWRLTSASLLERLPNEPRLARPLALLERFIQGEERHPELFDAIESLIVAEAAELTLVATILYHLGYLRESDLALPEKELIAAVNHGIASSNLA